jgi:hypothetical protein
VPHDPTLQATDSRQAYTSWPASRSPLNASTSRPWLWESGRRGQGGAMTRAQRWSGAAMHSTDQTPAARRQAAKRRIPKGALLHTKPSMTLTRLGSSWPGRRSSWKPHGHGHHLNDAVRGRLSRPN